MNAFDDHEEHLEQQAYYAGENQGYDQGMHHTTIRWLGWSVVLPGYDNGFDAGFDDGGGF